MQETVEENKQQSRQAIKVLVSLIHHAFGFEINYTVSQCEAEMSRIAEEMTPFKGKKDAQSSAKIRELSSRYSEFESMVFHLTTLGDNVVQVQEEIPNYDPYVKIHAGKFRFPNPHRRYDNCIIDAFDQNGMKVVDISRHWPCWTWVSIDTGDLWLHDTSHGCGGEFALYSSNKP